MITRPLTQDIQVLFSAEDIASRVKSLAQEIVRDLPSNVMIVGLLRGSFVFIADLIRAMHQAGGQPQVDFITLSSYGSSTTSSGKVEINRDLSESVADRDVLIVDDILESGGTLTFARDLIRSRRAKSIKIAVLLEKPGKRRVPIEANYVGFSISDQFVVGYGLDYANFFRELPYIGVIKQAT